MAVVSKREMTEPEAMVYAAAFAAACVSGHNHYDCVEAAHFAVRTLRSVRIRERRESPAIRMLCDFRMDADATPERITVGVDERDARVEIESLT